MAETRRAVMAAKETVTTDFSQAEATETLRTLGDNDLARLRAISRALARFSPITSDDLLQEAFCRAMDGSRAWPRHVQAVPFLAGVMRSIASDEAKAKRQHPEKSLEVMSDAGLDWPSDGAAAEEQCIAEEDESALAARAVEVLRIVTGLFKDDIAAETIVEGLMEGMEGEELRALTGLDKKAFASKRRLVRRRITKAFSGSENS